MSVNKVILVGRLGQDPEVRYTQSGSAVANFSIATSESWKDKSGQRQEKTEWHRVVCWGKQAELVQKYLGKGRQVYLEGRLQTRSWDDAQSGQKRYATEVVVQNLQFLGSANATQSMGGSPNIGAAPQSQPQGPPGDALAQAAAPLNQGSEPAFTEEDIPF